MPLNMKVDEKLWERAKQAVAPYAHEYDEPWAVVMSVYKKMLAAKKQKARATKSSRARKARATKSSRARKTKSPRAATKCSPAKKKHCACAACRAERRR